MNILSTFVLQFFFIYLSLIIGIPGIDKNNILKNKIILFIGIFIFQIMINSITKIKEDCKVSLNKLLIDAFFVSLVSIIGYSFYVDIVIMDPTNNFIKSLFANKQTNALLISAIISLFVFIIRFFQRLFSEDIIKCEDNNYDRI